MNKAFEKILEKLEEIKGCSCDGRSCSECEYISDCLEGEMSEKVAIDMAKEIVQEVAEEYNEGWIPCSERLPKVPKGIDDAECPEFNVTINGAEESTTLKYSWDGTWFDDSGNLYDVIAWQPLPETYQPK